MPKEIDKFITATHYSQISQMMVSVILRGVFRKILSDFYIVSKEVGEFLIRYLSLQYVFNIFIHGYKVS